MYDYLVVGSGLYGAIFAHEAKVHGKSVLVVDTLDKYPYCDALKKVKGSYLTKSQKVFVYFLKKRNYGMLKFLVDGRIWLKNIKGFKLKK